MNGCFFLCILILLKNLKSLCEKIYLEKSLIVKNIFLKNLT